RVRALQTLGNLERAAEEPFCFLQRILLPGEICEAVQQHRLEHRARLMRLVERIQPSASNRLRFVCVSRVVAERRKRDQSSDDPRMQRSATTRETQTKRRRLLAEG